MRKLSLAVTVGGALAIAAPVLAQETPKTETTKEKTEMKSTTDPGEMMNSTTDSTSLQKETKRKADGQIEERTEKTRKHDPAGLKKSSKSTEKEKTVKDADGKVLEHEKKIEK